MTDTRTHHQGRDTDTPLLEWILGAVGLLILLVGVVFLVWRGVQPERMGSVEFHVFDVAQLEQSFLVRFTALNPASLTMNDLHVTAKLFDGDREIERAAMTLDYLPARSQREGGVYLRRDPRKYRLEFSAEGYQKP